jgi:hypothetical protein
VKIQTGTADEALKDGVRGDAYYVARLLQTQRQWAKWLTIAA